jgi:hypothetical protein
MVLDKLTGMETRIDELWRLLEFSVLKLRTETATMD